MDESQKELQQIYQGQSAMKELLTEVHRKMDDIIARQERSFNAISSIQVGQVSLCLYLPIIHLVKSGLQKGHQLRKPSFLWHISL